MATDEMNFARLLDWLEGRLPAAEAEAFTAAVQAAIAQGDTELQRTVTWLRAFRTLSSKSMLVEPPAQARAAVRDLIRRRQPSQATASATQFVRRIIATLLPNNAPLVGVRSAGDSSNTINGTLRQLTYTSDLADIILNIAPVPGQTQVHIDGLVLPLADLDLNQVVVQLLRDGSAAGHTFTNDLGEFAFSALSHGSYTLVLGTAQADIEVGPLTLNA